MTVEDGNAHEVGGVKLFIKRGQAGEEDLRAELDQFEKATEGKNQCSLP